MNPYTINGILNVKQNGDTYTITKSTTSMGSKQDKIASAIDRAKQEILEEGPIYDIIRLDTKTGFTYQDGENLAKHLCVIANHLLIEGYVIYSLSIKDIYVLNNSKYLFTNPDRCVLVTPSNKIVKPTSYDNGEFIAPELVTLNVAKDRPVAIDRPVAKDSPMAKDRPVAKDRPIAIDKAAANWCIGKLILNLLFKDDTKLHLIKDTSLYYFINRCLDKNVELREVLYM